MENRRQYYRHAIPPEPGIPVLFRTTDGSSSFFGDMLNLSIGGLCVKAAAPEITPEKKWLAAFTLGPASRPLHIPVEPVHSTRQPGTLGFRFLPRTKPLDQEDQERQIWSYLLEEQRHERRQTRAG